MNLFTRVSIIVLVILISNYVYGQVNYKQKVLYELKFKESNSDIDYKSEIMMLRISDTASKFQSYYRYKKDSLEYDLKSKKVNVYSILDSLKRMPRASFVNIIMKSYNQGIIINAEPAVGVQFYTSESADNFKWEIKDSVKFIGKYLCKKATTKYAGRNYIAWYSEDIGISDGPYKFTGLPGLILELYDTNKIFIYSVISIFSSLPSEKFTWKTVGLEISLKKFQELISEKKETPAAFMEKLGSSFDGGSKIIDEGIRQERGNRTYNYIEIR